MSHRKPLASIRTSGTANDTPDHDGARGGAFPCVRRHSRRLLPRLDSRTDSAAGRRTRSDGTSKLEIRKNLYHTPTPKRLGTPQIPRSSRLARIVPQMRPLENMTSKTGSRFDGRRAGR